MTPNPEIFPAFRLVAQFTDGQRLLFDGFTEEQAQQRMEAATAQHGDITWYDGVTDLHYENGKYHALAPQSPEITLIDLTELTEEEWQMPVSPRKRQSNAKYNAKCDPIQIRPLKPAGAAIRAAADAAGQSLQSYIMQAVQDRMSREGQPLELPDDETPVE